jgi:hypothetical protein
LTVRGNARGAELIPYKTGRTGQNVCVSGDITLDELCRIRMRVELSVSGGDESVFARIVGHASA